MSNSKWQIRGDYFETCNCNYVCPCIPSQLQAQPTKGECIFAMAFRINDGNFDNLSLADLNFIIIGHTPEKMGAGNWEVGLIVDARANPEQQQALGAIVGGSAGGPMVGLAPLLGNFLGIEARPIQFQGDGKTWSVTAPGVLEEAAVAAYGLGGSNEPLYLDNTGHPAANRFALAHATGSHLHAFGIDWDDDSGSNNAQFAPFSWNG